MLLSDALARWALSTDAEPTTVRNHRSAFSMLAKSGITEVHQLTPPNLTRFQEARLAQGRSPRTFNAQLNAIQSLLHWLAARGEASPDVAEELGRLRLKARNRAPLDYYTTAEYEILLAHAGEPWFRLAIEIACWTGVRVNELSRLHVEDFRLDARVLVIRPEIAKRKKGRVISLCPPILAILTEGLAGLSGPLFPAADRRALTPYRSDDTFQVRMAAMREHLGGPKTTKTTFHRCRRTFTTWALQRGVPVADVARMLGHTSIQMLYKHYYAIIEGYNPAIERLGGAA
jgi:integrase